MPMPLTNPSPDPPRARPEAGGIAILVTLMLLVLMTLVATGMSRNSFREAVISGTTRQGAMARNVADSGLEWAVYWMYSGNGPSATSGSAQQFANVDTGLLNHMLQPSVAAGQYYTLSQTLYAGQGSQTPPADLTLSGTAAGVSSGFSISAMRMGKLEPTGVSQNPGSNQFNPATGAYISNAPNLWAIRSDGQVSYGGVTFLNSKEAWISTPLQ